MILSGSVEINPVPGVPKFPCDECHKAVSFDPSMVCDNCNQWFQKTFVNMNTIIFELYQDNSSMECLCCSYGLPNVASRFFDTTKSSVSSISFISQHTVRCKAKSLCVSTANFQILWNKKEEFETLVLDNYIDIVTGSENYLYQGDKQ